MAYPQIFPCFLFQTQPTLFPLYPFISQYKWHTCLTWNVPHEKKNSLSRKENTRGILSSVIQNMFYTCTSCMKLLPHLLLLFLLVLFYTSGFSFKLHYLQHIFCWWLTWLDSNIFSWLKTILWVLERLSLFKNCS